MAKKIEEVDSIKVELLGILFEKRFYSNNTVKHFVNGNEVLTFSTDLTGRNRQELTVSIISKVDDNTTKSVED